MVVSTEQWSYCILDLFSYRFCLNKVCGKSQHAKPAQGQWQGNRMKARERGMGRDIPQTAMEKKHTKLKNCSPLDYHPTGASNSPRSNLCILVNIAFFSTNSRVIFHFFIIHLDPKVFPRQGELQSHVTLEFHRETIFQDLDQPLFYLLSPFFPFSFL